VSPLSAIARLSSLFFAQQIKVPVVLARNERSVVVAECWVAPYKSKTSSYGELFLARESLGSDDRALLVDDIPGPRSCKK